jgi:hypothetical protein
MFAPFQRTNFGFLPNVDGIRRLPVSVRLAAVARLRYSTATVGRPALPRPRRRGAGVVERDGLENRCARKGTEGSNPSPSARFCSADIH